MKRIVPLALFAGFHLAMQHAIIVVEVSADITA
jgi:hypothetical protein